MKTDTITTRLHAKADADLKKKLEESANWIWEETGHGAERPKIEDHPDAKAALRGAELNDSKMPWIGSMNVAFKGVAFAYLRDKWRSRYVSEFMAKVEAMATEMENLGIVIQQQEE